MVVLSRKHTPCHIDIEEGKSRSEFCKLHCNIWYKQTKCSGKEMIEYSVFVVKSDVVCYHTTYTILQLGSFCWRKHQHSEISLSDLLVSEKLEQNVWERSWIILGV